MYNVKGDFMVCGLHLKKKIEITKDYNKLIKDFQTQILKVAES